MCVPALENDALQVGTTPGVTMVLVHSVVAEVVSVKTTLPADGIATPAGTAASVAVNTTD